MDGKNPQLRYVFFSVIPLLLSSALQEATSEMNPDVTSSVCCKYVTRRRLEWWRFIFPDVLSLKNQQMDPLTIIYGWKTIFFFGNGLSFQVTCCFCLFWGGCFYAVWMPFCKEFPFHFNAEVVTFGAVLNACRGAQKLEVVEDLLKVSIFVWRKRRSFF